MTCPVCGYRNTDGRDTCRRCGASLRATRDKILGEDDRDALEPAAPPAPTPGVAVRTPDLPTEPPDDVLDLDESQIAGRAEDGDGESLRAKARASGDRAPRHLPPSELHSPPLAPHQPADVDPAVAPAPPSRPARAQEPPRPVTSYSAAPTEAARSVEPALRAPRPRYEPEAEVYAEPEPLPPGALAGIERPVLDVLGTAGPSGPSGVSIPTTTPLPSAPARRATDRAAPPVGVAYAGFWIRVMAFLLDATVVVSIWLVMLVGALLIVGFDQVVGSGGEGLTGPVGRIVNLFGNLIAFVYFSVSTWLTGSTLGKAAVRVRVVRADGTPISLGRAIWRTAAYTVETLPGMILVGFAAGVSMVAQGSPVVTLAGIAGIALSMLGYLWAGVDRRKQAWHDKLAGTVVVRTS
jgi:uncharacterized RDD family membrane protein YckC